MRTLLMTLALAIGLGATAQNDGNDGDKKTVAERAAAKTTEMTKQLGLSAEQAAKVGEINKHHMQSMADLKGVKDDKSRENRERILKEKRDESLKAVLTADQYAKLMQIRAEKKEEKKDKDDKKPHNE